MEPDLADIKYILSREESWPRFQRFATDLIGKALQLNLVSGEPGSDLGRDAKWFRPDTGDMDGVVCVALRQTGPKAVEKFKRDFKRLIATGMPRQVVFANSAPVQEPEDQAFRDWAKAIIASTTTRMPRIQIFGLERVATAAKHHLDVFKEYYGSDLLALRHRILQRSDDEQPRLNGLRIALATQFNAEGPLLRDALAESCIAVALGRPGAAANSDQIAQSVGSMLQLQNAVVPEIISRGLKRLSARGMVLAEEGRFALSADGARWLDILKKQSDADSAGLKRAFCDEVRRRLNSHEVKAIDSRLPEVWLRLEEMIAENFWRRSLEVCNRILDLTDRPLLPELLGVETIDPFISELCGDIDDAQIIRRLAGAVAETVTDREGAVRSGLLDIVAKFVALCSMGIHPEAYEEVNARLSRWVMLLDTHVLLSAMCACEPDHSDTIELIRSWKRLGRRVIVLAPVIAEASYHAWIAHAEARAFKENHVSQVELKTAEIGNVFLREFLRRDGFRFNGHRWDAFIANYSGLTWDDRSPMTAAIAASGFEVRQTITSNGRSRSPRRTRADSLPASGAERVLQARWDDELLKLSVELKREAEKEEGGVVIVSESAALRSALDGSRPEQRVPLRPAASLGFAIAMTPGSSLSLVHVRELLFDNKPFLVLEQDTKRLTNKLIKEQFEEGLDHSGRKALRERLSESLRQAFLR